MEVINLDTANDEFNRFCDAMDIETSGLDDDDLNQFNKHKTRIVTAIQKGNLIINEDGEAVYTPYKSKSRHKEPLTFHERTGATMMAAQNVKKNMFASQLYATMGDLCKVDAKVFAGLVGIDIKTCESIASLLLD